MIDDIQSRAEFETWAIDAAEIHPHMLLKRGAFYVETYANDLWASWQASAALHQAKAQQFIANKEIREDVGVALAEAYVMIPKGMPWESATEKLEEAVFKCLEATYSQHFGLEE